MHLVYFDESGQTGNNLSDPSQPIFTLAALIVPEIVWLAVEKELEAAVAKYFPSRPEDFEIHATDLRNGGGYFRQFPVTHRIEFRDCCLKIANQHGLKLIYRAIEKRRYQKWMHQTFGPGVLINPHVVAFPLVARVVDEYLKSLPKSPLGIFIADECREIIVDVEKSIRLLRGAAGSLRLGQIVEKGFFIDSASSLLLQLCDLCVYSARKKEEAKSGSPVKPLDENGIALIEPSIHKENEAFQDTLDWVIQQKKERPGENPRSV